MGLGPPGGGLGVLGVEPAPAPYLVDADPRVVSRGDRVTLRYTLARGGRGRVVGIVAGPDPCAKPSKTLPIYDASDHIAPMFGTVAMAPGRYSAVLLEPGGKVLASSPFSGSPSQGLGLGIETDRRTTGVAIRSTSAGRGGPGNKLDYVRDLQGRRPEPLLVPGATATSTPGLPARSASGWARRSSRAATSPG